MQYRFGNYLLDPASRQLDHIEDGPVSVSARAFDVLVRLVSTPGTPVSRRELLDDVWKDCVVDENNLAKAIASLRKALGEDFIMTVPRQGYQFVVPVQTQTGLERDVAAVAPSKPATAPATAPLTLALTFGVAAFVAVAWFLSKSPDKPDPQPDGTGAVASANDHFERGQEFLVSNLEPTAVELAVREFGLALELDPRHLRAQLALAGALRQLSALHIVSEDALNYSERATVEYARAARLAEDSSTEFESSIQQLMDDQNWAGAEAALTAWLDNEPNAHRPLFLYGVLLQYTGHATVAANVLERAHASLPADLPTINTLSLVHNSLGNFGRVTELHEHARQQIGFSVIHASPMFWTLLGSGRIVEARQLNFELLSGLVDPGEFLTAVANREPPPQFEDAFDQMFFYSVLNLDRPAEGRAQLMTIAEDPSLDSTPDFLNFAMFASYFDAPEMSLGALEQISYAENEVLRFIWARHMAPVREQPEFASLLERFGLVDYWDASQWPKYCERSADGKVRCL